MHCCDVMKPGMTLAPKETETGEESCSLGRKLKDEESQ